MKKIVFASVAMCLIAVILFAATGCDESKPPEEKPVAVTGVELNYNTYTLALDSVFTLTATVLPANATNQKVIWTIEEGGEAFVSIEPAAAGMSVTVIAKEAGVATITATTEEGGKKAQCVVTTVYGGLMQMTMVTAAYVPGISLAGNGKATIDWGDGSKTDVLTLSPNTSDRVYVYHTYSGTTAHTITITGKNITRLICGSNHLTELDVSKNTALTELVCQDNQLTELDVSKNTALTGLWCSYNAITKLDVGKNTALTLLYCQNNQLTELDVSAANALTDLNCSVNRLTELKVSNVLTTLNCNNNQLTELDVSKKTALTELNCNNNQLIKLDVSKNTALILLNCNNNQLTGLDMGAANALAYLECSNNQLTGLNLKTALISLHCAGNQLTELDVSACAILWVVRCQSNQLSATALNRLFVSLPLNNHEFYNNIYIHGNDGAGACDSSIASAKRWTVDTTKVQ